MVFLIFVLVMLIGCGEVVPPTGKFEALDVNLVVDAEPPDLGMRNTDAGRAKILSDPSGEWVIFVEDRNCMAALGTSVENIVWSWYRVDVISEAGLSPEQQILQQTWRLCSQELSPLIGGFQTVIPDAIPAGLPAQHVEGYLLGAEPGDAYLSEEFIDLWGAEDVEEGDEFPSTIDDVRLVDHDADGEPGVSFDIVNSVGTSLCQVRVVQRTRMRFSGRIIDATRIEGTLSSELTKSVLDSTSPLCATDAEIVQSAAANRFVMVRVDGRDGGLSLDLDQDGSVSCAEIAETKSVLTQGEGITQVPPDNEVCR